MPTHRLFLIRKPFLTVYKPFENPGEFTTTPSRESPQRVEFPQRDSGRSRIPRGSPYRDPEGSSNGDVQNDLRRLTATKSKGRGCPQRISGLLNQVSGVSATSFQGCSPKRLPQWVLEFKRKYRNRHNGTPGVLAGSLRESAQNKNEFQGGS